MNRNIITPATTRTHPVNSWWLPPGWLAVAALNHAGRLTEAVADRGGKPVPGVAVVGLTTNQSALPKASRPNEAAVTEGQKTVHPRGVHGWAWAPKSGRSTTPPPTITHKISVANLDSLGTPWVGFEIMVKGKADGKPPSRPAGFTLGGPGVAAANADGCLIDGSVRGFFFVSGAPGHQKQAQMAWSVLKTCLTAWPGSRSGSRINGETCSFNRHR